jgi:hypothetical protein
MRGLLALLLVAATPALAAEDPTPTDRAAIHDVIAAQIDAFRHDDATTAFGFASPKIQSLFGTPDRFIAMVAHAYQPVYRPSTVAFGAIDTTGEEPIQRVEVTGPDGRAHLALYHMEHEPDGTWRIDGCELTDPDSVGA